MGENRYRGPSGIPLCRSGRCREIRSYILIVSDRLIGPDKLAIPALLATSAIHQDLVARGLRASTGLVVETGSAKETHHFALLAGYGAEAVHPYLALETVSELAPKLSADLTQEKAQANFIKAVDKGLMKIMSKMGIATYRSYCGAQIFEAVGLSSTLVDKYFKGTVSSVEGIGVFEVAEESLRLHQEAFGRHQQPVRFLDVGGEYAFRHQGEEHMFTPDAIAKLQHSTRSNNYATYKEYAQIINDQSRSPDDSAWIVRIQNRSGTCHFYR